MNPETWRLTVIVLTIVIAMLGVLMYVVWRMGSEPERDEHEDNSVG